MTTTNWTFHFLNCNGQAVQFNLDESRIKACIGPDLKENIELIDVRGDGNCGYHALVNGAIENKLSLSSELTETDNPQMDLHQQMYTHAQDPNVLKDLFKDRNMQVVFGLSE